MPVALIGSPTAVEFGDLGPLLIDDETLAFEDDDRSDRECTARLADPWVTATTRFACEKNS